MVSFSILMCVIACVTGIGTLELETPKYAVLKKIGTLEIRKYESMKVAHAEEKDTDFFDGKINTFMRLQRYMSGLNDRKKVLNLTFPLIDQIIFGNGCHSTQYYSKSYYIPSAYQENPPNPIFEADKVEIRNLDTRTMIVRKFGGWATRPQILKHASLLRKELNGQNIEYNSNELFVTELSAPWEVLNRTNEVAYMTTSEIANNEIHSQDRIIM